VRLPSVGAVSSHRTSAPPPRPSVRRIWELGTPGVRALAVFAALVAVLAGVLAWRARPQLQPVPPAVPSSALSSAAASATGGTLVVAVSGKVRRPGLVRLPAGSRVADAIDAAGGALPGTDLSLLNLARKVTDGELILVGIAVPPGSAVAAGPAATGGLVNLNTASLDQLQTLPGVGPVLAQRIVDYRDQHGGFKAVADLQKVSGIGDTRYNDLKNRVTV
jgi:competence protein ComEA